LNCHDKEGPDFKVNPLEVRIGTKSFFTVVVFDFFPPPILAKVNTANPTNTAQTSTFWSEFLNDIFGFLNTGTNIIKIITKNQTIHHKF
jgi:hypothetical protein